MNLAPHGGALDATVRDFTPGQKLFNRYSLKRILGRGGMGVVWLARDDVLDREVALKFLPDVVLYDRGMLDDLKRETTRSLELTHKNIVRIYDFVYDQNSGCISMEYVDGDTLSNIRADRPLRIFECWELGDWVKQLCEALDYAHNHARVVHRDLKPSNLMMNLRGDLKVTDFGIARSLSDSVSMLTVGKKHTSGTLVYMSPQQLDGARGSHLDDIYSLGATLYELLTSKPPFFSGNIDRQIHERKPPPMSFRREELDIVGGEPIDPLWEEAVAACLHKDPSQRPQSALEVITQLTTPARRTTSILGGWLQSAKTVTKSEPKTGARATTRPATKTRTATTQAAVTTTPPKRQLKEVLSPAWLAVSGALATAGAGVRTAGVAVWQAIAAMIISVGHGFGSFGRLVANDIAAVIKGFAGGVIAIARGAVFITVTPIKLLIRGVGVAFPAMLRVSRDAGVVLGKGSVIAARKGVIGARVLGRETLLGSAVTVVPATIAAGLIWFFAIRVPPPPKAITQQKPAPPPVQSSQAQTSVGLIEPVAPKPAPPPPKGGLSIDTAPSGAQVIVDGTLMKMSPASISDLPPGKHHLQIVLQGYVTEERDVDVRNDEIAAQGTIALQPIAPPAPPAPIVTADGVSKPAPKEPEQEQTPVVKRVVRNKPSVVTQKPAATPVRQAAAAQQLIPATKAVAKPVVPPKPTPGQKRMQNPFGEGAPGG